MSTIDAVLFQQLYADQSAVRVWAWVQYNDNNIIIKSERHATARNDHSDTMGRFHTFPYRLALSVYLGYNII